jgi:hypothetical protein
VEHYRQRSGDTSTLLHQLFQQYRKEGVAVPYTMEDFRRDFAKEFLQDLSPEERLAGLSPEQIRALLPPEQILAALSPEQILAALSPEAKEALRRRLLGSEPPAPPG